MSFFNYGGPAIQYQQGKNSTRFSSNYDAVKKSNDFIITTDDDLKKTKDYQTVHECISKLVATGVTKMGEGYCISVSDIIFNLLTQWGIKCHLEEVKLSIMDQSTGYSDMVGFDTTFTKNSHLKVSTHVVVVTDTEIPMLIDGSIAHKLPNSQQCIIQPIKNLGSKMMCNFEYKGFGFLYQEKADGFGIPQLHQISILDRMGTDKRIFDTMKQLRILNIIGILLSAFAVINVIGKIWLDWYN
jgi:hypothetical protein